MLLNTVLTHKTMCFCQPHFPRRGDKLYECEYRKSTVTWAGAAQQREACVCLCVCVCVCVYCIFTFKCTISLWAGRAEGMYSPSEAENTNKQKVKVSTLNKCQVVQLHYTSDYDRQGDSRTSSTLWCTHTDVHTHNKWI